MRSASRTSQYHPASSSSSSSTSNNRGRGAGTGTGTGEDSPLFERQVGIDEYNELHQSRTLIEQLQHRIQRLEHINVDLEQRLEDQAKETMALETECISIERTWKSKCELLENEIQKWRKLHEVEQNKSVKLNDQLSRKEKELYGILQRKYELMRGPAGKMPNRQPMGGLIIDQESQAIKTPAKESQRVRERKAIANLSDFLGF